MIIFPDSDETLGITSTMFRQVAKYWAGCRRKHTFGEFFYPCFQVDASFFQDILNESAMSFPMFFFFSAVFFLLRHLHELRIQRIISCYPSASCILCHDSQDHCYIRNLVAPQLSTDVINMHLKILGRLTFPVPVSIFESIFKGNTWTTWRETRL